MKPLCRVAVCVVAGLLPSLLSAQGKQPPPVGVLAITGVTVIDATGAPARSGMTVVVSAGRITDIGPATDVAPPPGAQVVDGSGKFLIPGLWDMHVHTRYAGIPFLPLFVANGVTGVRDTGGPWDHFEQIKRWRTEIAAGRIVGPRIISSGPLVDGPNSRWTHSAVVRSTEEARKFVDSLKERGGDFIKVYDLLSRAQFEAIVAQAARHRLPFIGHVPWAVSAAEASDAGQRSIEHLSGIMLASSSEEEKFRRQLVEEKISPDGAEVLGTFDAQKAQALFSRLARNGTWQVPTLVNTWVRLGIYNDDPVILDTLRYVPSGYKSQWNPRNFSSPEEMVQYQRRMDIYLDVVGRMRAAGVEFMAGTDTLKAYNLPGVSLQEELNLLARAGLSPMEVIQAATRNPARFLGLGDLGTVEKGKIADLVLLEADPLAAITNTRRIAAVILGGRLLSREFLQEMLAGVEREAASWQGTPSGR